MKCRISVTVKDGRVVNVRNLMGVDCPKGRCSPELVNHPERVTHPLKRAGERGHGRWVKVSWDEAMDTMASHFSHIRERFGPVANAVALGCAHKEAA